LSEEQKEGRISETNNSEKSASIIQIPISVIADRTVSILESIVEYLKDELKFNYHEIGKLTNRNERTIWTVYNRTTKKRSKTSKPTIASSVIKIPLSVLFDRKLSSFETVVEYLKEQLKFNYHEIGELTNRDERTIWTLYNRARKKRVA